MACFGFHKFNCPFHILGKDGSANQGSVTSKLLILKLLPMASLTANHVGGWIYYSIAAGLTHTVNWKQLKLVIAGNRLLSAPKILVLLGNALTPKVSQTVKAVKPKPWHLPYIQETEEERSSAHTGRQKWRELFGGEMQLLILSTFSVWDWSVVIAPFCTSLL